MQHSIAIAITVLAATPALADSTIDPAHKHAWGENIGWTNWRDADSSTAGVELSEDAEYLSGYIWGENVGWISLGSGAGPYANLGGANHGVNVLPAGYLDGFAWGENVGWINFGTEPSIGLQGASYDSMEHRFRGYAWGENIGWITLDDATHYVAIQNLCPADLNGSGEVESGDLASLLAEWDLIGGAADLDGSGTVDSGDLAIVLASWGPCPM